MRETPFLAACRSIQLALQREIASVPGTDQGGQIVGMGADQSPTKAIDQIAERCVLSLLEDAGICSKVLSEEAGMVSMPGEQGTIYLDPIDGTFNAVSGIPFYALSLAYGEGGAIQEGFVLDLASSEEFYAVRGGGAYCNGSPIHVSSVSLLEKSAMSLYGKKFDPGRAMQLGSRIRRWRLFGASALELCYVACGRLDGFVDLRNTLRVTDAAAGMLICREAGGMVSGLDGTPVHFPDDVGVGRCMVATNAAIHRKVIEYLR